MTIFLTADPCDPDPSLLQQAVSCLRDGGTLIYPTETFYGLGVHYAHEAALLKLHRIKERDASKPVLLLIPDVSWMRTLASAVPAPALTLAGQFWPGPLTLVLRASAHISTLITGDRGTVGMRISSNPVAAGLVKLFGDCITSTSANRAGESSPSTIRHISGQLLAFVDMVIDAGETPGGMPSTVLDITTTPFSVVREGAVPAEAIRACINLPFS
jgi:L-threonylcarbamoyladenylate synthase